MLTLPIERKWFDMILQGIKTEEYREVKPYYTKRFKKWIVSVPCHDLIIENEYRAAADRGGIPYEGIVLRNGYSHLSGAILIRGRLMIREGRQDWGAEPGKEYYVLTIENSEILNPGITKER
jgi:hypothetical protein